MHSNISHCIEGLRLDKLAPFTFRVVLWICLNKNIQLNQLHLPITRHQSAATCKKKLSKKNVCRGGAESWQQIHLADRLTVAKSKLKKAQELRHPIILKIFTKAWSHQLKRLSSCVKLTVRKNGWHAFVCASSIFKWLERKLVPNSLLNKLWNNRGHWKLESTVLLIDYY